MSLGAHFKELRNRLVKAALGVLVGGVVAWFIFDPLIAELRQPIDDYIRLHPSRAADIKLTYGGLTSAFSLRLSLTIFVGVIVSSPLWLYQVWAFIVPGLTKREKRISVAFVAAGVPLFLGGVAMAHFSLPLVVNVLLDFAAKGTANFQQLSDYISFVTRFSLGFGLAFLLPLFQIALNMIGILSVRAMLKSWRVSVFLIFVFAAMMMPTPDPYSMMLLALPLIALFFGAIGVSALLERGKRRSRADWLETSDDEASAL